MRLMGKAAWVLTLVMVFLSSLLLIVASRASFDAAKKMAAHTNLSEVEGDEKAAAAAVDADGLTMQRVVNVGTSRGRNPPSAPEGAAAAAAASARQVPTGPDPIHHHQSPIRH